MKLLTITPFLKAEIKARNINGKGGAILHQAHPFRTYPKGFMPWVGLAISIYSESQKFSIQEFQVVAYQDNNEISRESRVFDEDISIIKFGSHCTISWRHEFDFKNLKPGLVTIKIQSIQNKEKQNIIGESSLVFHEAEGTYSNSFHCFVKNTLSKFSKKYRAYLAEKNSCFP
jgi:hypothetical protein